MSRQSRITEGLAALEQMHAIKGFKREVDPKDNSRVRWLVQIGPLSTRYFRTNEVEAMLEGAELVLSVQSTVR